MGENTSKEKSLVLCSNQNPALLMKMNSEPFGLGLERKPTLKVSLSLFLQRCLGGGLGNIIISIFYLFIFPSARNQTLNLVTPTQAFYH